MTKNIRKGLLSLCCIIGIVCGCNRKNTKTVDAAEQSEGRFVIGYCINSISDVFQIQVVDAVKTSIIAAGGSIKVLSADNSAVKQRNQAGHFAETRVDGLIVVPVDTDCAAAVAAIAHDAGIPLCFVNRNPYEDINSIPDGVYVVGSEENILGRLQADYAGKTLNGRGNVGILMGPAGQEASRERTKGNKEVFHENYPEITVLVEETADWDRQRAITVTNRWLKLYGKQLTAILANNDEMALGAIAALHETGNEHILVFGIDATIEGKAAVRQGKMRATVLQNAEQQGQLAAQIIIDAVSGKESKKLNRVPFQLIDEEILLWQEKNNR